jgi:hypothetical protein
MSFLKSLPFLVDSSRIFIRMSAVCCVVFLAGPRCFASSFEAWSGLASLNLPPSAVVSKQGSKSFLVEPRTGGRTVLLSLSRHALSRAEQAASLQTLGLLRKKNFEKDGFKVSRFVVDAKRKRISMDLSGRVSKRVVPLNFRGSSAIAQGRFVAIRSGSVYVSAIVASERKNWGKKQTVEYRRAAESLRVRQ